MDPSTYSGIVVFFQLDARTIVIRDSRFEVVYLGRLGIFESGYSQYCLVLDLFIFFLLEHTCLLGKFRTVY